MIEDLWYKNAVIYSVDLESFMDGNGDGCGDFGGLNHRLDYLQTLGVDILWLEPFHPSPWKDNGYDVEDYYGVHPRYGTLGDFVEFVHEAKKRGIRVIMDLVVNHTSDRHPWFRQARRDPKSRFRQWYLWSKKRPKRWNEGMVFPGVQERTWTRDEKSREYYFHRFYPHQPDLNLTNPEVRTEVWRIIGFWVQLGVHGFRLDALPFVISAPPDEEGHVAPGIHFEHLEEMRSFLQWRMGDAIFLGEANVPPADTAPYFADGRGIHLMFNFWVNQHLFLSLARNDATPLKKALEETRGIPPTAQWAQFLRNHDELDLGRLSDEERAEVFARFGPEERMQIYGRGLRRRLGPMLGNEAQSRLAYSLLFSLPGTPVIRYGDEIGMGEDLRLPEREAVRTPMQWSSDQNGGFSTASGRKLVHPVLRDGPWGYPHINVDSQRRNADSMLQWMGKMIRLRKECPEIGWGTFEIIDGGAPQVLLLLFTWRGSSILTVHNLDGNRREVSFTLPLSEDGADAQKMPLFDLMHPEELRPSSDEASGGGPRYALALEGYAFRWYRVKTLNYALERTPETPQAVQPRVDQDSPGTRKARQRRAKG